MRILVLCFLAIAHCSLGQWDIKALPGHASIRAIDVSGNQNIWISGSNGSIYVSNNGGVTWENKCPEQYKEYDFRGVAVLSDSTIIAMSAGDGAEGKAILLKTKDGGKTWYKVLEKTEKGIFFDSIKFKSPWTGYVLSDAIDQKPYLLKTIDAGETWFRVEGLPDILPEEASFAASNSCITTLGDNVWFNTQNRIFQSFDSGKTWQVHTTLFMKGSSQGIFGLFALDAYTLIAVGGDYLPHSEPVLQYAYSSTGGSTWYTNERFWKVGLTECISFFGKKSHLISVGTHGTAVSKSSGLSWEMLDKESFHVVRCIKNRCYAAGADGRVGVISFNP